MPARHTTLRLDAALMKRAKEYAREQESTLTAVMERALAEYLARPTGAATRRPRRWTFPTGGRGGPRPGVDLDNSAALLDLMDGVE